MKSVRILVAIQHIAGPIYNTNGAEPPQKQPTTSELLPLNIPTEQPSRRSPARPL